MAIVETRELKVEEFNTTQLVAKIDGLDPEYTASIRTVIWSCYEGRNDQGTLIEQFQTTLENGYSIYYNVFSDLKPNTTYYMTALISNIKGLNGDILYCGSRTTAISGGGQYPDSDTVFQPGIKSFDVKFLNEYGNAKFTCVLSDVYDYYTTIDPSEEDSGAWYTIICIDSCALVKEEFMMHEGCNGVTITNPGIRQFTLEWSGLVGSPGEESIHTVKVININTNGIQKEISKTIKVVVPSFGVYELIYTYKEKENYEYDNGRVTGTIYNYISISAEDWNNFIEGINTLKIKVGGITSALGVIPGDEFSADLWNDVIYAIWFLYDECNEARPDTLIEVNAHQPITPQMIDNVNEAVKNIKDKII